MLKVLLSIGIAALLGTACSSTGSDNSVAHGTGGSNGDTGGSNGDAGGSNEGGNDCNEVACIRAYECVSECGSDTVLNNGCCPCPAGMIDQISCPSWTITQGIAGQVLWLEGNHMPGSSGGTTTPISREVRVYERVSQSDVVAATDRPEAYAVYSEVDAELVATGTSNADGSYEVALEPGMYSLFVEDEGDWYCNLTSAGALCPLTVHADQVAEYTVRIDYAASY